MGIEVLWPEFYKEGQGWRYYVRCEYGVNQNYYLETEKWLRTYKPQKWEDE